MRTARLKGKASDERWHVRKEGSRFFTNGVMMPLRVGNVLTGFAKITTDLTEKQRRAEELQRAHDQLELRVKERTRELAESNLALVQEMEVREIAERQRIDLLGRLVTGQEVERRRIARDLHDQLGQRLTALRLKIASLKEISAGHEEIALRVGRLQEIGERLDAEVSFLAWELRPTALDDLGLVDAVGAFVNEWSRHYEIPAEFHSAGLTKARLNHDTETHLYRITQEALNNILKHANATLVTVMLEKRDRDVILIIEDNGHGFNSNAARASAESGMGLGLIGMRERAILAGGELEVESSAGKGATIYIRVPIYELS
jgi:signal transduction histidine kinase